MRLLLTLVILMLSLTACDKQTNTILEIDGVQIRLVNTSNQNFHDVEVYDSNGTIIYGDINAGQTTDYQKFNIAYNYIHPTLTIGNKQYQGTGWCPVGEKPLEDGYYTFEINLSGNYVFVSKVED